MDQAECRDTAEDFQKRHERRAEALRTYHDKLSVLIRSHPSQRSNKVKDARWGLALLNKNPLFDNEDAEYKFVQKSSDGVFGNHFVCFSRTTTKRRETCLLRLLSSTERLITKIRSYVHILL